MTRLSFQRLSPEVTCPLYYPTESVARTDEYRVIDGCFEWRTHWSCQRSQTVCLPCHLESGLYSSTTSIWHEVVSKDDMRKLVMKSKTTSCALDPLPTKLVKQYIPELLPLLMHIINLSIATGEFPQEWKTAFVVLLLKKAGLDPIQKKLSSCIESPICV